MNQNIIINVFTWIIYTHTYKSICYSLTMNLMKILYEVYVLLYSYECKIYKRGLLSRFKIETNYNVKQSRKGVPLYLKL